ncbi:MAG: thioredoxin family protein [Calditrichaeota bacterium]|nr:thioredoxin family protein [Calditrichota bacterium]
MCPAFEHPETIIQTEPMVLGYFTRPGCGVCSALLPKVERLLIRYPTVRLVQVDVQRWPRLAGQHLVFAVPTLILFYRGREWHRFSRWVSLTELEKALARMVENLPETDE